MLTLRPYQEEGIAEIRSALRHARRVLYQAPTGSGKGVIVAFMARGAVAKGRRVCVMVHRRELVRDLSGRLDKAGVPHHVIAAGTSIARAQVCVASVQTLARRLEHYRDFDFLIVDEGHHCLPDNQWGKCVAAFPKAKVVAFSATPQRLDGRGLGESFDELVIGPKVRDLIEEGYLAPYAAYAPKDGGPDLSGVRTRRGDYDAGELVEKMSGKKLIGDAVHHYRSLADGQPAIAFCITVEHAETVAAHFAEAGYRAASVDGSLSQAERDRRIKGLENGAIQVLTSCELISEGLDVPGVSAVIMLRPTQSLGLHLQQIGRGLRPKDDGRKAIILDHAGNISRHGLPCQDREWSLTSKKRKAKETEKAATKTCKNCEAIAPLAALRCAACGFPFAMPRELPETLAGELVEVKPVYPDRPIPLRRNEIAQQTAGCRTLADFQELARRLGFKPGWAWHQWQARMAGRDHQPSFLDRRFDDRLADDAA